MISLIVLVMRRCFIRWTFSARDFGVSFWLVEIFCCDNIFPSSYSEFTECTVTRERHSFFYIRLFYEPSIHTHLCLRILAIRRDRHWLSCLTCKPPLLFENEVRCATQKLLLSKRTPYLVKGCSFSWVFPEVYFFELSPLRFLEVHQRKTLLLEF